MLFDGEVAFRRSRESHIEIHNEENEAPYVAGHSDMDLHLADQQEDTVIQ